MRIRRSAIASALVLLLAIAGCSGPGGSAGGGGSLPSGLAGDAAKAAKLEVGATGGGASVRTGEATAGVSVPEGAAEAGAVWSVVPLTQAPAGVKKPLCPGVFVDTAGKEPKAPCAIGFAIPGTASPDATIVRISDDGKVQAVATDRITVNGRTVLTASVDGFSAYTTSEEDAAARDKAFTDREKARGKSVDWTIKVIGSEQKKVEGWTFDYQLDLFASGGGVGQAGTYKGHASLSLDGKYDKTISIIKGFGTVNGIGRDQNLTFTMIDPSLAYLSGSGAPDDPQVDGFGAMKLEGMGGIDITAVGPNAKGHYKNQNVKGSGGVPFTLAVKGEDVQVEIANLGIFPGKILRTSK